MALAGADRLSMLARNRSRLQRHRGFALLWVGATASRLATEMYSVAVVLFVLAVTGSAQVAGLTVAAATLPTVVTGPLVGAWLDRTPHRRTAFLVSPIVLVAAMIGFLIAGDAIVMLDPYTGRRGPRIVARAATAYSDRALA